MDGEGHKELLVPPTKGESVCRLDESIRRSRTRKGGHFPAGVDEKGGTAQIGKLQRHTERESMGVPKTNRAGAQPDRREGGERGRSDDPVRSGGP